MAPDALVRREVAIEAGLLALLEPREGGDGARPLVIAVPGFFAGDEDLTGAPGLLGVYADGCVVPLTQARMRTSWSVESLARALEGLIAQRFAERRIVLLGASIGATACLAVRAPNLRRVVAIEPILRAPPWPVVEPIRQALAGLAEGDGRRRRWFELFGVGETAIEPRDHRPLLRDLTTPVDVILGAEPLGEARELPRFPSLVDEPERRALAGHPRVRLRLAPGVGHNVQNNAGPLVVEVLLEACRRAAAEPGYEPGRVDEALLEALAPTARRVIYLGDDSESFGAAVVARNPQANVEPPGGGGAADAVAVGACPEPQRLAALAAQLAPEGRLVMRWTREGGPAESGAWLAAAGLAGPEVLEPGIVRLRRADAPAAPRLHLHTVAFAPLLMDIRARLPAQRLTPSPELTVAYRSELLSLPRLARETPKVLVLQRPAEVKPHAWIAVLAPLIADDWVTVMEYDDHPAVVAELRGGAAAEARMRRMGFVHAVQTTTPPLAEAFRAMNPEVALFPNAVFDLPPFPEAERGRRVFYGGVVRGAFAVDVARSLGPLAEEFPDLEFVVVGDEPVFEALAGRKSYHPYLGYESYLTLMASCAVSLSPLEARPLMETKSDAKYLDAARAGVVTIASPAAYDRTIVHEVNGYLARSPEDWPAMLRAVLRDPQAARRVARTAWEDVRDRRMFAQQAQARIDWYFSLWARRAALTETLMDRLPGLRQAVASRRKTNP